MTTLYLSEADVARLVDMPTALAVVEECLPRLSAGEAANVPRMRAQSPGIILHTMSAAAEYLGVSGWKAYTTTKQGARFLVALYDNASGRPLAFVEADRLGQLRTGAVTGVAVKHLANPDANMLGLFGTGTQARTQLAAAAASQKLERVFVYGRDPERRRSFAKVATDELQIDVVPVDDPRRAVRGLPIVVTATTSRTPVFDGADVAEGALVCAVGSNWLNKAEIDVATIARAAVVVCDDVAACRHEAGDLVPAVAAGVWSWDRAIALGDAVAGRAAVRKSPRDVIVFKSVGLAIEDVALGAELLRRAREHGIGAELPF